jgi:magnesium chelatase subunit I
MKLRSNQSPSAGTVYPFTALVGQEEMKLALLLGVIDRHIGGVLIMGERGTGKSTAVRALADLLPGIVKVKGCVYGCDPDDQSYLCGDCFTAGKKGELPREKGPVPVVDLPLGATEDRVCGTLDIERALAGGIKVFEPGLLARANRGFLYIDEVNLLDDHLVDVLLDAAASGRNVVEREGISATHPARFVLVGSGNPEEGELRPQLLDRFGLHAQIATITDLDQRVEIVERRDRFDRDPIGFRSEFQPEQERMRRRLVRARKTAPEVKIDRSLLVDIAGLCASLKIDGHRGELTIARAARALAGFEGRRTVRIDDISRVSVMALRHRLRKDPLESIDSGLRIEQAMSDLFPQTAVRSLASAG